MNFSSIKSLVTSQAARQLLTVQKHSPVLLFGAGVVGVTATVVLACRGTLKLEETLIHHQKNMESLNEVKGRMTEEEAVKTKALIYTKTVMDIGKLYAPAVVIGVISIGCLTGSHVVLTKRNAGLTAAYAALEKGFNAYRKRVVDEFGEDKDREFRYGTAERHVTIDEDEDGPVTVAKKVADPEAMANSPYARLFGKDTSNSWNPYPEYNIAFLRSQQNYLNDRLRAKGHVFLNDAYDALGLDRTKAGSVVGWLWKGEGDNYVDFGLFNKEMQPQHYDFFTGRENAIWLDFNVDGVIWDKI